MNYISTLSNYNEFSSVNDLSYINISNFPSWNLIKPSLKKLNQIYPFLTFPLLKACNLRCRYCGEGGELSASMIDKWDYDELIQKIEIGCSMGINKIRLTGGEPFLYNNIVDVFLKLNKIGIYTHVNTNGSLIENFKSSLSKLQSNFHFAVSLDTLNRDKYHDIVGRNKIFDHTISGIHFLRSINRLLRINMVVTQDNIEEIFDMIDFCRELQCNLKLLDVVSVPLPYSNRQNIHANLSPVEYKLASMADYIINHEYARSFGTPCHIYGIDNVEVTIKNTWNGSRYDVYGVCRNCEYFPCHEGLYDVFALPDGRVSGCRWSATSVAATNDAQDRYKEEKDFYLALKQIATIFQNAEYVSRHSNEMMRPYPDFVMNSLKKVSHNKRQLGCSKDVDDV